MSGMIDAIATGFGGEKCGQVLRAKSATRPLWTLVPLPLFQVAPARSLPQTVHGPPKSLSSICLAKISREFHHYTPSSFGNVSPVLLKRIFDRVRHDREYDQYEDDASRPDEATIWALSLLTDPEAAAADHSLALPIDITLQHLTPKPTFANPLHPFIGIPKLYAQLQPDTRYQLITSLHLDGINDLVNDQNIISLKYATHLTVLRMIACRRVSDSGVRLLAAALELPGKEGAETGRGMWRLRAWYLQGCKGVGDKSMPLLARWPGLLLLDIRNTSCTTSAINIFNRQTEALFPHKLAHVQICSQGLFPLFNPATSSAELVTHLSRSLFIPTTARNKQPRPHRSLNLLPAYIPIAPECLPNYLVTTAALPRHTPDSDFSTYRAGGIGQVYGGGVRNIEDKVQALRKDVNTALYMQALEEGLHKDPKPDKEDRWWEKKDKPKGKVIKTKKGEAGAGPGSDERSKQFAAGGQAKPPPPNDGTVRGHTKLMLVRVAQEGWETLSWKLGVGNAVAISSEPAPAALTKRKIDLVGTLLGSSTTAPRSTPASGSGSSPPIRPSTAPRGSMAKKPAAPPAKANPFRPTAPAKRPVLPTTSSSSFTSSQPSASSSRTSPSSSQMAPAPRAGNPFATPSQRPNTFGVIPLSSSPAGPASSDADDFASSGKKRSWGGVAEESTKRRGMKMFSGARM